MDVDTCRQLADTRDTRLVTMEPPHADPESDTEDTDPTKLLNQWLGELNTLKKVNYSSRRHQHWGVLPLHAETIRLLAIFCYDTLFLFLFAHICAIFAHFGEGLFRILKYL